MPATRKKKTSTTTTSRSKKSASKSSSKSSSTSGSSTYDKLIKKGMSPKQAAAFSKQSAKRASKKK